MSYTKTISVFSLMIGVTVFGVFGTHLDASADDMSVREVEALLQDRMEGLSQEQVHGLTMDLFTLCQKYDFTVSSVLSVISTESGFNQNAISPVGAVGLMQIMPRTAGYIAKKGQIDSYHSARDLYDPRTNITIGIAYLSQLRSRFVQSHRYLAAYNMGPAKYNRFARDHRAKPLSVAKYVLSIHNGVYQIRQDAQELVSAQQVVSPDLAYNQ